MKRNAVLKLGFHKKPIGRIIRLLDKYTNSCYMSRCIFRESPKMRTARFIDVVKESENEISSEVFTRRI